MSSAMSDFARKSLVLAPPSRVRAYGWSFNPPDGLGKFRVGGRRMIYYIHIFGLQFSREKLVASESERSVFDASD